jgi:uncharacterized protein YecT (DUF1311 family)
VRTTSIAWRAVLVSLASTAAASGGPLETCYDSAATRLDVGPCLEGQLATAENALEAAYAAGLAELRELSAVTGRDTALKGYREAREKFTEFRAADCRWRRLQAEPGTGAADFERDCLVRATQARTAELRQIWPVSLDLEDRVDDDGKARP